MRTSIIPSADLFRLLGCVIGLTGSSAQAVLVADNGFGTANMPLAADYATETPMHIIDGLPVGDVININGIFKAPGSSSETPGGTLGGSSASGTTIFEWTMTGTGGLSGFNRLINIPISSFQVHTAPRTAFAPVQNFNTLVFFMQGQVTLDPDFDLLRLSSGDGFGLSSPGQTSLSQSGSNWEAGSYYDLTYRIDFVGRPGGALSGRSGSTTGTVRISVGTVVPEPSAAVLAGSLGLLGLARCRR